MTVEDVKRIAIEKYGIKEEFLIIDEIDENEVYFCNEQNHKAYIVLLDKEFILPVP